MSKKLVLPTIPLRDIAVFPGVIIPLFVGRSRSMETLKLAKLHDNKIFLVSQKSPEVNVIERQDLYDIGTVAQIMQSFKLQDGTVKITVESLYRGRIISFNNSGDYFESEIEPILPEVLSEDEVSGDIISLVQKLKEEFNTFAELDDKINEDHFKTLMQVKSIDQMINVIASYLPLSISKQYEILAAENLKDQLEILVMSLMHINQVMASESKLKSKLEEGAKSSSKDTMKDGMGASGASGNPNRSDRRSTKAESEKEDIIALQERADKKNFTPEARNKFNEELKKLTNTPAMSSEAAILRNYLEWLLDIPWNEPTELEYDLTQARAVLDSEHYGLEKVKEQILGYIAVQMRLKKIRSTVLCFVGPPGVGKTSIGKSIAQTMGRKFTRIALGGVRDEAEMRGHRRTYLGALPGKIIQAMKKVKSSNPLILLDEIDKMSYDQRGDPASALLEILDGEQNHEFNDHYIEVGYDLSDVMFVTTANSLNIHPALRDRMEIIRLSGYTEEEKVSIAKKHLIPKLKEQNGLTASEWHISDGALLDVIRRYTREAGVRNLERSLGSSMRKALRAIVTKEEGLDSVNITVRNTEKYFGIPRYSHGEIEESNLVGVSTGLAYTEVGGDILSIECIKFNGDGKINITGKLGDVMKESVQAAYNLMRSKAEEIGINLEDLKKYDIHVHFPEGATPKDGPSAGIAIFSAMVSLMTGIPVDRTVAMTGEITLRGKVLEIGGLKEKLLAAVRSGIKTVMIPEKNKHDVPELPKIVREQLQIKLVSNVYQVLETALIAVPKGLLSKKPSEPIAINEDENPTVIV